MLLHELTGYHSAKEDTLRQLLAKLKKNGKYETAHGSFAVVLIPPGKNYVFRAWTKDAGYEKFLAYIEQNPSKHFPKIIGKVHDVKIFFQQPKVQAQDVVHVVRVEKLKPLPISSIAYEAIQVVFNYLKGKNATAGKTVGDILEYIGEYDDDELEKAGEFIKDNKSFFEFYLKVAKWAASNAKYMDLRAANILMRDNGDLVITDPIADVEREALPKPLADQLVEL